MHLRVIGSVGDSQVLSRKQGRNGHPFVCEDQKGEAVMWVPRREPGGCTGAGVGVAITQEVRAKLWIPVESRQGGATSCCGQQGVFLEEGNV